MNKQLDIMISVHSPYDIGYACTLHGHACTLPDEVYLGVGYGVYDAMKDAAGRNTADLICEAMSYGNGGYMTEFKLWDGDFGRGRPFQWAAICNEEGEPLAFFFK